MNNDKINHQECSELLESQFSILNSKLNNINAAIGNIEYLAQKLQSFNEIEAHFSEIKNSVSEFSKQERKEIEEDLLDNIQQTLEKDNDELNTQSIKERMKEITSASNWIVRESNNSLDYRTAQRFMDEFIHPERVKSFIVELPNNLGKIKKTFLLHYAYGYAQITFPFNDEYHEIFDLNYLNDEINGILYSYR